MRILQVLHFFLPRHSAGTEVYTLNLSRALAQRHEVALFFTEKHISQPQYQLRRRRHHNLPCFEMVNNLCYRGFEETFSNPKVDAVFADVLAEYEPQVVHVQHLMLLSLNIVRIAKERGIPVVMTLHDFWLFCSRFGQLLRGDGSICDGPAPRKCADCLADFKFAQTSTEERLIKAISWTRRVSGFDLAPLVGWARGSNQPLVRVARSLTRRPGRPAARGARNGETPPARSLEEAIRARAEAVRDLIHRVDVFTAPSRTVRERAIAWGVPRGKIRLARYGIDGAAFAGGTPARRHEPITFGFIGTLAPHKGVHVLVAAFALLRKGMARLKIFGRFDYYPDYVQHLRSLARGHDVSFEGLVPREHVDRAFAAIDCLVVPSLWLENSPVVIQESFLAGRPVITSDLGGMAELVKDRRTGRLFKTGDVRALARCLREVVNKPQLLEHWAGNLEPPRSVEDNAQELELLYSELVNARPAP